MKSQPQSEHDFMDDSLRASSGKLREPILKRFWISAGVIVIPGVSKAKENSFRIAKYSKKFAC